MNIAHLWGSVREKWETDSLLRPLFALAGDLLVYLVGAAIIGLGNFILMPLYTRHLNPAEFGIYALVDVTILILVTVTQLGFGVSYLKWFADIERSRRGELLGSTLISGALAASIGGGLLALAAASPLGERWLQTADRGFAWTLLPIVVLENLQGLLLTDLRARQDYAGALDWYRRAEALAPERLDPKYHIGYTYYLQQDDATAESYFRQALAINPQHPWSAYWLAKCLYRMGERDEAIRWLRSAIEWHGKEPWTWATGGWRISGRGSPAP